MPAAPCLCCAAPSQQGQLLPTAQSCSRAASPPAAMGKAMGKTEGQGAGTGCSVSAARVPTEPAGVPRVLSTPSLAQRVLVFLPHVSLGVLPQPRVRVSAGDQAAMEGGSVPPLVPPSPGPWCCQAGADPRLQQHWGERQCWRSPGLPTQPQGGPGTAPECGPCGCARERGSASVVPALGLCSCRAQLQRGRARGRAPASPGSLRQLLAPAMTPSRVRSLPSTAARPEPEGFPALRAGRWSLGICQAPLPGLCPPGTAVLCPHWLQLEVSPWIRLHHQKVGTGAQDAKVRWDEFPACYS